MSDRLSRHLSQASQGKLGANFRLDVGGMLNLVNLLCMAGHGLGQSLSSYSGLGSSSQILCHSLHSIQTRNNSHYIIEINLFN